MSLTVLNTFTLHMTVFLISECYFTTAMSTTAVTEASEAKTKGSSLYYNIMNALLPSDDVKSAGNTNKGRYKRQGESRMTPAIMLRLYMKVIKTMIWGDAEDADHPLSKPNADPVVDHIKKRYFSFMFEEALL